MFKNKENQSLANICLHTSLWYHDMTRIRLQMDFNMQDLTFTQILSSKWWWLPVFWSWRQCKKLKRWDHVMIKEIFYKKDVVYSIWSVLLGHTLLIWQCKRLQVFEAVWAGLYSMNHTQLNLHRLFLFLFSAEKRMHHLSSGTEKSNFKPDGFWSYYVWSYKSNFCWPVRLFVVYDMHLFRINATDSHVNFPKD